MKIKFEVVTERDFEIIKEIYDFYIENSTATYYTEKISIEELKAFTPCGDKKYKSYMILAGSEVCGFCYFAQYKKRQAYDRTAEVSIYLKPDAIGKGIGNAALLQLENAARESGIAVLIGIISGDNGNSIRLFEKNGYEKCGHLKKIGEKFSRVLDVVFYQKMVD
jgi:L-amino acid N-acyltransferase YncA